MSLRLRSLQIGILVSIGLTALALGPRPLWAEGSSPAGGAAARPVIDSSLQDSERQFYREMEEQARLFYLAHREQLSHVKEDLWNRMTRQSIYRLKQMKGGSRDLLRFARPAARTFVVTNVLSTFVLPPILTAVGLPNLAVLVLATPFEPFVAAGQVLVMRWMDEFRMLRKLGIEDYRSMKALRKKWLEMPERRHVTTLIHSDMLSEIQKEGGPLWLAISKTKKSTLHGVSIAELEALVGSTREGRLFLATLVPFRTEGPQYGLELWMFVEENAVLRPKLVQSIVERSAALREGQPNPERELLTRQMHELIDLKKAVYDNEIEFASVAKGALKRLPANERQEIRALLEQTSEEIRASVRAADAAETRILLGQLNPSVTGSSVGDLSGEVRRLQEQAAALRRAQNEAGMLLQDRSVTAESLRRTLGLQAGREVTDPLQRAKLPCYRLFEF